jgi:hypothetical protein
MTQITYTPLPTDYVEAMRNGAPDAYGLPAEHATSDGTGLPCRHCLNDIPAGADMLILAHRPFETLQPYAETGPIFLCGDTCAAYAGGGVPPVLSSRAGYLLKGYTADQRIRYGTGKIVPPADLSEYAAELLARDEIAFVDVRSASNNCFMTRITSRA